ncbi:hypothetical protein [Streptomyces sp. NPDC058092]|uniref:hypothetical protein n=1 Tax=Streptomyces sp. NPDC058092 TaxID=3346336 RepID=UPI0036E0D2C6
MIYQVRRAWVHLALGDIAAALDLGHQVIDTIGGVNSARATSARRRFRPVRAPGQVRPPRCRQPTSATVAARLSGPSR